MKGASWAEMTVAIPAVVIGLAALFVSHSAALGVVASAAPITALGALDSNGRPGPPAGDGIGAIPSQEPHHADCPADLELLVERSFARESGLDVGERVLVATRPDGTECPATVAGVYEPRADPSKLTAELPRVILHLPQLARLLGRTGEADRFAVRVEPGTDETDLRRSLTAQLSGAQVVPTDEVIGRASTTFEVVRRFHRAIGLITLTAGGAFLACIMILKIQERRTPIAAMRLLGTSRRTLVGWLVLEAALVSALGGVAGVAVGQLASAIINRYYQWTYDTSLVFSIVTPEIILRALGLAVLLGLTAGAVATLRLLSVHPLEEAGR